MEKICEKLESVLENDLEEIRHMELGSEERSRAVKDIAVLCDQVCKIDKMADENDARFTNQKLEELKLAREEKRRNHDEVVDIAFKSAGIVLQIVAIGLPILEHRRLLGTCLDYELENTYGADAVKTEVRGLLKLPK